MRQRCLSTVARPDREKRQSHRCQSSSLRQSWRCSQHHLRLFAQAEFEVSDGSGLQVKKRLALPTQLSTEFVSAVLPREALRTVGAGPGGRSHRHLA